MSALLLLAASHPAVAAVPSGTLDMNPCTRLRGSGIELTEACKCTLETASKWGGVTWATVKGDAATDTEDTCFDLSYLENDLIPTRWYTRHWATIRSIVVARGRGVAFREDHVWQPPYSMVTMDDIDQIGGQPPKVGHTDGIASIEDLDEGTLARVDTGGLPIESASLVISEEGETNIVLEILFPDGLEAAVLEGPLDPNDVYGPPAL